jgi:hypothetical protein
MAFGALLVCAVLVTALPASASDHPLHWLPADAQIEAAAERLDLYHDGLSGRLVRVREGASVDLSAAGGVALAPRESETLFVYWLADAELAEFEAPARVLVRSGREVVVATTGDTPRLTAAAIERLPGLRQPVRIHQRPMVWPSAVSAPLPAVREHDPLIQAMVDALTTENFMATWQALEDFVTRYTHAPENELATQWMLDQFLSFGLDAEFHIYQQSGPKRNVIATLPGTAYPEQVVYICAHLDATSGTPEVCAPGADDNGSGTAAVIEAARVMSQYLFEYTIKFALWNGEEQGLVGSEAYVAQMAAAGEQIIGAFNMDMIAYRGTDPAPPDLILYTNPSSMFLANTLATACDDYVPGTLEPIVLNESLGASDHASFWQFGYDAILAIEEEAWGSDFCPWYHTCDDLIWRYPQDYVLNCAKANLAATATTAVPLNPTGPYLVLDGTAIDDDAVPPSNGDGDGTVNPGETIELWATVRNVGNATAESVTGELTSSSTNVSIVTSAAAWDDIPAGGEGTNLTSLVFEVGAGVEDGEVLPFTLTMTDATGSRDLSMQLVVAAPRLAYYLHRLDDGAPGNGNGVLDPGETVRYLVTLANAGGKDAAGVEAQLSSASAHVTVVDGLGAATSIASGEVAELSPPYSVQLSGAAPAGEVLALDLAITAGTGYQAASSFKVKVGTHFFDDAEAPGAWSLEAPDDDAETGRWVRVDPIGTVYNSQQCQTEDDYTVDPGTDCFVTGQGSPGGSAGEADVDNGKTTLTTPTFDLTSLVDPTVTYWRWYTNDLGNNPGEDEWVVQVTADGGASWVDLERTTQSNNAWQEMSFVLDGYITVTDQVAFRFIASDYGSGSLVEAAIDDFEISGEGGTVAVVGGAPPLVLRLAQARPSPLRAGTTLISFTLPGDEQVALKLYGVEGRLVRTLTSGLVDAGRHDVVWDGRNDAGQRVAPGVYFYRLEAGERELPRKLVVVR